MKPDNGPGKIKKILGFSLILLITVGTAGYLLSTLWQKDNIPVAKTESSKSVVVSPAQNNTILTDNEILSERLKTLSKLDEQFVDLLSESQDKKKLDAASQLISVQEEVFRGSIDSIFLNTPKQPDSNLNRLFGDIVSGYRTILENRRSMSSLRNAINLGNNTLQPGDMALLKLQNELQEKNNRIAALENNLKIMQATKSAAPAVAEHATTASDNNAELEKKIASLTAAYYSLKQDNEKLEKQQDDASKNKGVTESALKNKAASLQQKVEMLNAELSLAQVDCNLNRADAGKIIYNSRQRKELLSEASGILTSLAKSDDADIRKKVQDKITRLNQVAANSRD